MGRLTNKKKILLLKIQKARHELEVNLKNNFITDEEIFNLIHKNINFGINKTNYNYKESCLKNIFTCPFLLCDQKYLSSKVINILPIFLDVRYKEEQEQLLYQYNNGYISKEEYENFLDELEFIYYKSSLDGKNILKTGYVNDNVIKVR